MLSDQDIQAALTAGELAISPWDEARLQPCSVDLTLGESFVTFPRGSLHSGPVSPAWGDAGASERLESIAAIRINPGEFYLASTVETVTLSAALAARVEGKSSLGRWGLQVHSTAGFIDAGFSGQITLELLNTFHRPLILSAGMKIAQLSFFRLDSPAARLYGDPALGSKYQGQTGATPSLYHLNP